MPENILALGFASAADAVGRFVTWGKPFEIVGVVKDYHHQSLREAISPIIFMPQNGGAWLTVRLSTKQMPSEMATLERLYKATYPGNPFDYFFVNENYNQQYQTEQQYGQLFRAASLLAIFIACLGLFGLAMFMTEQRTKEIGFRKVLGASVGSIVALLSRDFLPKHQSRSHQSGYLTSFGVKSDELRVSCRSSIVACGS